MSQYDCIYWMQAHKKEVPELKKVHSQTLQDIAFRLDGAYKSFFRRVKEKGKKAGFPRYQGEGRYNSFTYTQSGYKIEGDKLHISKVGWVKIKQHRELEGKINRMTVTKSPTGKWFACFICEVDIKPAKKLKKAVGIDVGIESFTTDSNGESINYPRHYEKAQKNLAKLQRKHQKRKTKKTRKALATAHEKVKNKRKDFLHQTSRKLVNETQVIAFENLNTKALMEKHWVSKQIADASWATFISYVTYKAEWAGRQVVLVNPAYTSQTCSQCGFRKHKPLSQRVHKCSCGLELSRDHNAAINILAIGLDSLELKALGSPSL